MAHTCGNRQVNAGERTEEVHHVDATMLAYHVAIVCGQSDHKVFRPHEHGGGVALGGFEQRHALAKHHGFLTIRDAGEPVSQANEGGHVFAGRTAVQRLRVGDLFDTSVVHHADAVGNGERFFLIVGHEHGGGAGFELDAADFVAQLHTNFGVKCGKRLVEQEHSGVHGQCAGERHTLLLTARHLLRVFASLIGKTYEFQLLHGLLTAFRLAHAADFQPEFHVLQSGHVWEQRVRLEHHGHVSLVDGHASHILSADENTAGLNVFQACEGTQRGGFAAAGATEQHDHFTRIDF